MSEQNGIQKRLSLFDSTCLIVGVIVGSGIYVMTPHIMRGAKVLSETLKFDIPTALSFSLEDGVTATETIRLGFTPTGMLIVFFVAGGLLSLMGASIYTELATRYPREGGDYVYLTKAYRPWAGFLFGWVLTVIVRPGDIAVFAFFFSEYAVKIWNPLGAEREALMQPIYAVSAVVILTLMNMAGVQLGKWTQNILTVVKVLGLATIVLAAVLLPAPAPGDVTLTPGADFPVPPTVAFLFVLFVFGGWVEMAYVAAEVKNVRENLVRTAFIGLATVVTLYVGLTLAFVHVLGYDNAMVSGAIASDTVESVASGYGGRLIAALICISALGGINGLIFAGSRVSYALGHDHPVFKFLGKWNTKTGTPVRALAVQGVLAVTLLCVLKSHVETIVYTSPVLYTFFLLCCLGVYVLREKKPEGESPYRVWGYPFTPFIFGATCLYLMHGTITYKPLLTGCAFAIMLAGLPIYWLQKAVMRGSSRA